MKFRFEATRRLVCAFVGLTATTQAQLSILDKEVDKSTGSEVEVLSVFDKLPPTGFAPLRVTVRNRSGQDLAWRFESLSTASRYRGEHTASGRFAMDVPAGSSRTGTFLAPVATNYGNIGYSGDASLQVTAINRSMGAHSSSEYAERPESFPSLAMSKPLAAATLTKLEDQLETKMSASSRHGSGQRVFASRFDPKQLPEDWLGYSGLDFLLMRPADWEVLNPGQRRAILQWVRLGGGLHLYKVGKAELKDLGIPDVQGTKVDWSQGELAMFEWSGKDLPSAEVVNRYWGKSHRLMLVRESYSGKGFHLRTALGERSFAAWQVLVFLAIFGILVGPINLFVLAPPGKRHKLFFTTPILSIGASVAMIGLILLQDGTGGEGRRMVTVELRPEETLAYVCQEQVTRTGVLTSTGFPLKQPALIQALALPESQWTKLTYSSDSQSTDLQLNGLDVAGLLFQSRTEQAQLLQTPVSTRARVELKLGSGPGAPPTIVSALGFAAETLYYIDPAGEVWKAPGVVGSGSEVTLDKSTSKAWSEWHRSLLEIGGPKTTDHLKSGSRTNRGQFYALAKAAPDFIQPTLPSIRWKDDQVVVFGPVKQP